LQELHISNSKKEKYSKKLALKKSHRKDKKSHSQDSKDPSGVSSISVTCKVVSMNGIASSIHQNSDQHEIGLKVGSHKVFLGCGGLR